MHLRLLLLRPGCPGFCSGLVKLCWQWTACVGLKKCVLWIAVVLQSIVLVSAAPLQVDVDIKLALAIARTGHAPFGCAHSFTTTFVT
jgi:hypothetical protein